MPGMQCRRPHRHVPMRLAKPSLAKAVVEPVSLLLFTCLCTVRYPSQAYAKRRPICWAQRHLHPCTHESVCECHADTEHKLVLVEIHVVALPTADYFPVLLLRIERHATGLANIVG